MMHRCNVGSCSCGQNNSSFSMMFEGDHMDAVYSAGDHMYSSFTSSSSSVDCTLSLGTPSTRVSNENERRRSSFGWNVAPPPPSSRNHRGGGGTGGRSGSSNANSGGGDPLLARRCANCDTTSTPLWRNGPRGPKSLCNACGIRFKKEERRATAANGGATSQGGGVSVVDSSWIHHHNSQGQKTPCYTSPYGNEFRFIEDHDDHTDNAFLSWRFNVQDRPSLVHDFTR